MTTTLAEATLEACLAASDQVYSGPANGSPLSPISYPGPPPGQLRGSCSGWSVLNTYPDPGTGFLATVYSKTNANGKIDYVVAFRGSRGPNPQDWNNNLSFAWPDWASAGAGQLMNFLTRADIASTTNQIAFTGHSLGGALAQYAAYEYIDRLNVADTTYTGSNVGLVTFNAPGVESSMYQFYDQVPTPGARQVGSRIYDPTRLSDCFTRHYYVDNDIVSTLGSGHLGDSRGENDYVLSAKQQNGLALSLTAAHSLPSLYAALSGGFSSTNVIPKQLSRLNPHSSQQIASIAASAIYNEDTTNFQAQNLLFSGVVTALAFGDPVANASIIAALMKNLARSGTIQPWLQQAIERDIGGMTACVSTGAGLLLPDAFRAWALAQVANALNSSPLLNSPGFNSFAAQSSLVTTAPVLFSYLVGQIQPNYSASLPAKTFSTISAAQGILSTYANKAEGYLLLAEAAVAALAASACGTGVAASSQLQAYMKANTAAVITLISTQANWLPTFLSNVMHWCYQANGNSAVAARDGLFAAYKWVTAEAIGALGLNSSFAVSAIQPAHDSLTAGLVTLIGAGVQDFAAKKTYSGTEWAWIAALPPAEIRNLGLAFGQYNGGPAVDWNPSLGLSASAIDAGLAYVATQAALATQDLYVAVGNSSNPFTDPAFIPSTSAVQAVAIPSAGAVALTIYLAEAAPTGDQTGALVAAARTYRLTGPLGHAGSLAPIRAAATTSSGGQIVQIALAGAGSGSFTVLDAQGHVVTPSAGGTYVFTVPAGATSLTWSLVPTSTLTGSGTISVTATLGAPGAASNYATEYNALLSYGPKSPGPTLTTITGIDSTQLNVTNFLGDGNADLMVGTTRPMVIYEKPNGESDYVVGTSSGDTLYGSNGNNTIIGGGGPDILAEGSGSNILFEQSTASLNAAIAQGASGTGSTGQGSFLSVGDGNNVSA